MLYELMELGSVTFWTFIVVSSLAIGWLVETHSFEPAGWIAFMALLILQFLTPVNCGAVMVHHIGESFIAASAYAVVGVCWSRVKWHRHVTEAADTYERLRNMWLAERNLALDDLAFEAKQDMIQRIVDMMPSQFRSGMPPAASNSKQLIIGWATYWPFSLSWNMVGEPIKAFRSSVAFCIVEAFQEVSDRIFTSRFKELR